MSCKALRLTKTPWVCSPGVKRTAAASKEGGEEEFEVLEVWGVWMAPRGAAGCRVRWIGMVKGAQG